ncbi:MAG: hypothetical protein OEY20_12280 [Gemmatimonadota bacterium]|nr:hypothetical protein [Gemmatimonadota bacterium]MDH4350926.1 hypothetical protein [Gemmatimonadota bacterium]MDH5198017.1 hypothetical protein [Gemmatimonadota bacterium]
MRQILVGMTVVAALLSVAEPGAAQGPPSLPLVREGVCPFECCIYGPWVARTAIPVFAREGNRADTVGMLAPGDAVEALTGNVHIRRAATAVFQQPYRMLLTLSDTLRLAPGDTVYVLDHISEGVYHVWYRGTPFEMDQQWVYPDESAAVQAGARALADGPPETEWWVRIRQRDGREGWILLDPTGPAVFDGSDACGD